MKDLRVNINGNQTGFQQVLNSVKHEGKKFSEEWSATSLGKRMVLGAGSFLGFEAIKSSIESFIQNAAGIRQMAEQLDMSAEATQKWEKAADRLGLSFGVVQNVLQAIGSKRLEALFDPKVADQFQRLGVSRGAVLDTEKVNTSEFARLVMRGAQSEEGRGVFAEMFGNRALKTIGTGDQFGNVTADFDDTALEAGHKAELAERKLGTLKNRLIGEIARNYANVFDLLSGKMSWGDFRSQGVFLGWRRWGGANQARQGAVGEAAGSALASATAEATGAPVGKENGMHDPLESVKADKQLQREMQIDAAERGQHERERQLMTIGQRRVSIMQDMLRVRRQIEQLEDAKAPENLKNAEEIADWEAKRQESLSGLRGQLAGYKAELRERPVFGGAADSLSRLGLFSSISAMTGPPGSGVNELVSLNKRMEHHLFKIANKQDPHTP